VPYFDEPAGGVKLQTTSENIKRYYTPKHLIRDLLQSIKLSVKKGECDSFARAPTCPANRFSTVQITVQYRCIFVLLFGRYSLQLDNNTRIFPISSCGIRSHVTRLDINCQARPCARRFKFQKWRINDNRRYARVQKAFQMQDAVHCHSEQHESCA